MSPGAPTLAREWPGEAVVRAAVRGLEPHLDLVLLRVRLRARRRAAWLRKLWAEEGEPGGQQAVTHAEVDTHLAGRDAPAAEAAWLAADESAAGWNRELAEVEAALAEDRDSPLARLARIFALSPEEIDLLHACLAQALDPSLTRVYAYLHDHAGRGYLSEELAARLFGQDRSRFGAWSPEAPLCRWELAHQREVAPGEPAMLTCDPQVSDWLRGHHCLDAELVGVAEMRRPLEPLRGWPVAETAELVERLVQGGSSVRLRIEVEGAPGSGRRTFAAAVCARLGLPLLALDADRVDDERWPLAELRAQRQAYLEGTALAWHGESLGRRSWPLAGSGFPVQFLVLDPGQEPPPAWPEVVAHRLELPAPGLDERRELWRRYLPSSAAWPAAELEGLVGRHRVTVGEIAAVARKEPASASEAAAQVRSAARHRLGKLARLLECPFGWDDLVIPPRLRRVLEDLVFEARERAAFWERHEARRLFPQGRGLLGLFSGPPGTGKTMAAQVIAAELEIDLFRIDLSSVVSKYVGETSQNLERVLARARHMDVVLLFDEADALFGKRTEIKDAHDRFANTDTDYLLQAIEDYQGIALLSTNKKGNVDPAFLRRLRYVLEFPRPDVEVRATIWRRVVGELAGADRLAAVDENGRVLEANLEALGQVLELTGAQIKNAVLAAIFIARREERPLGLRHLLDGVDRELMKEGRALSDRDRQRVMDHGA